MTNKYAETQKRYYRKNAEKIKAANKARYHLKKQKSNELELVVDHLKFEVRKIERIAYNLGFISILNIIALIIICFIK